jgi:hypothetical protein
MSKVLPETLPPPDSTWHSLQWLWENRREGFYLGCWHSGPTALYYLFRREDFQMEESSWFMKNISNGDWWGVLRSNDHHNFKVKPVSDYRIIVKP